MKIKNDTNHERRLSPRVDANCNCWLARDSVTVLGTVLNISTGGLFMRTPIQLSTGSAVDVTLDLDRGTVVAKGHVAWKNKGVGISFKTVTDGQELLFRFVRQNAAGDV